MKWEELGEKKKQERVCMGVVKWEEFGEKKKKKRHGGCEMGRVW